MHDDPEPRLDTPGLAAGPGPTPPGFDDGPPRADEPAPDEPGAAEQQRQAGELSERSAGTRQGEIDQDREAAKHPPEQQPDEG